MSELYLVHHGVKGMHWGVRRYQNADGTRKNGVSKQQIRDAKQAYKAAKKNYNKSFNKYYYGTPIRITQKQRNTTYKRWQKALVDSGELGIKKGEYKTLKAQYAGNTKQALKGKRMVERAMNAKAYNSKVLDTMNKGYTYRESVERNRDNWKTSYEKQQDINAKYRKKLSEL